MSNLSINNKSLFAIVSLSLAIGLVAGLGAFAPATAAIVLPNGDPDPGNAALKLWLKADADVFNVADTTAASNGQSVAQWKNQVTGAAVGTHATQSSANNKPTFISSSVNGNPAVRFDGLDPTNMGDWLGGTASVTAEKTIFAVLRDTGTSTNCCSGAISTNGNFNSLGTKSSGGEIRLNIDWGGSPQTSSTDILNQDTVAVLTWNTSGAPYGNMYLNGSLDGSENQNKAVAATSYLLGTRQTTFAGRFFKGDIAEVLIYDGEIPLSSDDHQAIGSYLVSKYNLRNTNYAFVVPEPGTFVLAALGLLSMGLLGRRRRQRA